MSKHEERLLSESGRLLTVHSELAPPSRGSGDWGDEGLHETDGLSEHQGKGSGERPEACMSQCHSDAPQDIDEAAALRSGVCSEGCSPLTESVAGGSAASLLGSQRCQTLVKEKAACLTRSTSDKSDASQQAQPRDSSAASLTGREGCEVHAKIRTCTDGSMLRKTSEVPGHAASFSSMSGVQAELQQLQEMFSSKRRCSHVAQGEGQVLTQEQADLALAARLQDEEVRLHRKRVSVPLGGAPSKSKAAKLNTLDAFVKRMA